MVFRLIAWESEEMTALNIQVRPMTDVVMNTLEEKGLVRPFRATQNAISASEQATGVDCLYATNPKFGPHMLICVGFNRSTVDIAYHSDSEDFILINEGRNQKPLILVVALHSAEDFQKLLTSGQLTGEDMWAIRLVFNDPELSFFTMNGFTPHCEWTIPGDSPASVFYVSEPRDLDVNHFNMGDYRVQISF
jgi:hypothetical protein